MRGKGCLFLTVVLVPIIAALHHTEVKGSAEAHSFLEKSHSRAHVFLNWEQNVCDMGPLSDSTWCYALWQNTSTGSRVQAHGHAWLGWRVLAVDSLAVDTADWGEALSGLKGPPPQFLQSYDSVYVELTDLTDESLTCRIKGVLRTNYDSPHLWSRFDVGVHHYIDLTHFHTFFHGWALLAGHSLGGTIGPHEVHSDGNWKTAMFDTSITVSWDGDRDNLYVGVKTHSYANWAPSLSEIGRVVLVIALAGTGIIFFWWRKRRNALCIADDLDQVH